MTEICRNMLPRDIIILYNKFVCLTDDKVICRKAEAFLIFSKEVGLDLNSEKSTK